MPWGSWGGMHSITLTCHAVNTAKETRSLTGPRFDGKCPRLWYRFGKSWLKRLAWAFACFAQKRATPSLLNQLRKVIKSVAQNPQMVNLFIWYRLTISPPKKKALTPWRSLRWSSRAGPGPWRPSRRSSCSVSRARAVSSKVAGRPPNSAFEWKNTEKIVYKWIIIWKNLENNL